MKSEVNKKQIVFLLKLISYFVHELFEENFT